MRTLSASALFLILHFGLNLPAASQWKETNGPYGAAVGTLAWVHSTIFAGSNSLYRSDDGGESWTLVLNGFPHTTNVVGIQSIGDIVLVATQHDGIYHSTDGGRFWIHDTTGMGGRYISGLSASGSKVYAVTYGWTVEQGVRVSRDSGRTWLPTAPTNSPLYSIEARDSLLLVGTRNGCLVSTDGGTSWTERGSGLSPVFDVYAFAFHAGKIFAGTGSGLFVTSDTGRSWIPVRTGLAAKKVYSLKADSGSCFACMDGGLFSSTDGGKSWSAVQTGLTDTLVSVLEVRGDTLLMGTYTGIFRSLDRGKTWLPACTGLKGFRVNGFAGSDTNLYCVTNCGLFHSSDNGINWTRREWNVGAVYGMTFWHGSIFASCGKGLLRSDDNGSSWTTYRCPDPLGFRPLNQFASTDSILCAGGAESYFIFRMKRGDTTWQECPQGASYAFDLCFLDSTLYSASNMGVSLLQPHDTAWTYVSNGLGFPPIPALAAVRGRLLAGTRMGVYVSTDRGLQWVASSGIPSDYVYSIAASGSAIFAGCSKNGIYLSRDLGERWVPASEGITSGLYVYDLYVAGNNLLAETNEGVWMRSVLDTTLAAVEAEETVVTGYRLLQNYPNPFNPSTTIRYALPQRSWVTLSVYNALGQLIAVLVHGEVEAGYHEVQFHAGNLASGVYYCKLMADDFAETRALLLMK